MAAKKDPNYIVKLEKAIAEKYGAETVQNPRGNWTPEKEAIFIEQLKTANLRIQELERKVEKIEVNGVLVSQKLLNRETNRTCPVCSEYSFNPKDDVYMSKFQCCFPCYIQYVEDRETRWAKGWRPDTGDKKTNGNNT
jgi:predicted Holliday junction resolvase-like endonuclease